MEEDNKQERERLYEKTRQELLRQQLSNAETYDRSILSISSAFLGLSLAFIKDITAADIVRHALILYLSWIFFAAAIISTIYSIIYGQKKIKELMEAAYEYFIELKKGALDFSETVSKNIDRLNRVSGFLFIVAIILSVIFVGINFKEATSMSKENRVVTDSEKRGQPVNTFQKLPQGSQQEEENAQGGKQGTGPSNTPPEDKKQ